MFHLFALTALLSAPLFVLADPTPLTPGPGDVFKVGGNCSTTWTGDSTANSPWKVMNIELMSGSNLQMVHITTLTPNSVDGTVSGVLNFVCPQVTPNSAIYFYQYSSPNSTDKTWTTRFTIADANGNTVPPANSQQPNGDNIPWGVGALVNPADAVAAPVGGGGAGDATASASTNATSSSSSSSISVPSASPVLVTSTLSSTPLSTAAASMVATASGSAAPNGALGSSVDTRVWGLVAGIAALAFAL
jgi:hypothetical protein